MSETNKNSLATPFRSTAAVFSDEAETRKHVERMQKERKEFNAWLDSTDYEFLTLHEEQLIWESWKASARVTR